MKINKKTKKGFFILLSVLFWIAVWESASRIINLPLVLPSPARTLTSLMELIFKTEFWKTCAFTVLRIFAGALSGVVIGSVIAVLSSLVIIVKYLMSPIITVIKATPVASFIILLLVLIGKNSIPSVTAALITVPIIYANVSKGIDEIDKELLEVAKVYRLSFKEKCRALFLPSLEPYFISGIKSSIGLSWKAGIAAEVLCKPSLSIGTNIDDTRIYLETPELFAWTAVVIVLSLIFEKLAVFLLKGKERKNEHND